MEAKDIVIGGWYKAPIEISGSAEARINVRESRELVLTLDALSVLHSLNLLEFVKPIPLTEEWLLKLGFKKNDRNEYLKEAPGWKKYYKVFYEKYIATGEHAEGWLLQCVYAGSGMRKEEKIDIPCGYLSTVHQLQNLYFALTGEDLIVK